MKQLFAVIFSVLLFGNVYSQTAADKTHWTFEAIKLGDHSYELQFKVKIDKPFHIFGLQKYDDGPTSTELTFTPDPNYKLDGNATESGKVVKEFAKEFGEKGVNIYYYFNNVTFSQKIKTSGPIDKVVGTVYFGACNEMMCLQPTEIPFSFDLKSAKLVSPEKKNIEENKSLVTTDTTKETIVTSSNDSNNQKSTFSTVEKIDKNTSGSENTPEEKQGLWAIFFGAFLGGLAALITPCVFPMIPLTVSFFTKKAKSRTQAIANALVFGFSIILIYEILGILVSSLFSADTLNGLSTNLYMNLIFFVVFIIFALSFLGAFDITLPSSWVNKADARAEKGGIIGIFFMAFTLALVSFSCTGPVVGPLLVLVANGTEYARPIVGMLGFSVALAMPFTLFAIFPNWMHSMPKSGGWLNVVKVSLGFIELALALKFLSVVDMAYHWDILKREYFLILWIVIFTMLGQYLMGKIKFSHDSDTHHVSLPRLMFAIFSFGFAVYMVPGLWGAPLNLLSGMAPPLEYSEWTHEVPVATETKDAPTLGIEKKYKNLFHQKYGIDTWFDYDQAFEVAKKLNKPVMIDFTGHGCTNCRLMESNVWSQPEVLSKIKNNYVLLQLYVDDRTPLEKPEKSRWSGVEVTTIGKKWADLEATQYKVQSQPYYVLLGHDEKELVPSRGFNSDVKSYAKFLDEGIQNFEKSKH